MVDYKNRPNDASFAYGDMVMLVSKVKWVKVDLWFKWSYDGEFRCYYHLSFSNGGFRVISQGVTSYGWKGVQWLLIACRIKAYLFWFIFHVCNGGIYYIELKNLV